MFHKRKSDFGIDHLEVVVKCQPRATAVARSHEAGRFAAEADRFRNARFQTEQIRYRSEMQVLPSTNRFLVDLCLTPLTRVFLSSLSILSVASTCRLW
jgi:hypothetical protein